MAGHTDFHSAKAGAFLDASLSFATQNSMRKHRLRPVRTRKGLEGRGAVAPIKKFHAKRGIFLLAGRNPRKARFFACKKCAQITVMRSPLDIQASLVYAKPHG
jgi:hypothetical protein